jgi:hypothetical protein
MVFRAHFLELYRKSALPDATPLRVVAPTDKREVVSASEYLEVSLEWRSVMKDPPL